MTRRFSKEEWFTPINDHQEYQSLSVVVAENEKGEKLVLNQEKEAKEDYTDTPLMVKGKKPEEEEMTADDLTNDPEKAKVIKEEFKKGEDTDDMEKTESDAATSESDSEQSSDTETSDSSDNNDTDDASDNHSEDSVE